MRVPEGELVELPVRGSGEDGVGLRREDDGAERGRPSASDKRDFPVVA